MPVENVNDEALVSAGDESRESRTRSDFPAKVTVEVSEKAAEEHVKKLA